MKIDKIYIITDAPFPAGMASTNRILSYCKGFDQIGKPVEVLCFRRTENHLEVSNLEPSGVYQNIKFRYLHSSPIKSKSFVKRRLDNTWGVVSLFCYTLRKIKSGSLIIYYSSKTTPVVIFKIATLFKNVIFLKEESEHPNVYLRSNPFFGRLFLLYVHYVLFDGLLLMTHSLIKYFNSNNNRLPVLHVPMTVDPSRFTDIPGTKRNEIAYTGILNNHKDGIDILIKSFGALSGDFPEYKLVLYGKSENEVQLDEYKKMARKLGVHTKVVFAGNKSNKEIPYLISRALVLVLPRPDSEQAQNGFPTKLGEYLITGNPVVVTSVGDIPHYLKDGESAFIAIPGSVDSFVYKLKEVLTDYKCSQMVGAEGKKVAEKYFNNLTQTQNILQFAESL